MIFLPPLRRWLARREARKLIGAGQHMAAVVAMQRAYGRDAPAALQWMHDLDDWAADRKGRERLLWYTHTPDSFSIGSVRDSYKVTRVERTTNTALAAGGAAPCWRVIGRKLCHPE